MGDAARVSSNDGHATGDGGGVLRFAGRTLDPDGHVFLDGDGAPVGLTRGEFALLLALARRPGLVLTRDQLLDAISGRRRFAFDRSIDMMVARLRRKIGDDGHKPRLIATVPGIGYKLAASVTACPRPPESAGPGGEVEPGAGMLGQQRRRIGRRGLAFALAALAGVALTMLAAMRGMGGADPIATEPVTTVVLPFANLGGPDEQGYFARGVAAHLAIQLGSFPVMRVIAAPVGTEIAGRSPVAIARALGADYVVEGGVLKGTDRVRITAQLYDARSGIAVWGDRFDAAGIDPIAMQEDIADRIYRSVSGFRGIVHQDEIRTAWRKATPDLGEYDYVLRGHEYYLRFTREDVLAARRIWQAGLERYPGSALLRGKLAWTHVWMVMNLQTDDMPAEVEAAWQLARAAERVEPKSPMTVFLLHYIMAFLYQLHDNDFARSVEEAREALKLAPYDPLLRTDLSFFMANAGHQADAVDWARWAVAHEADPPAFYWNNLGWALYLAGRYEDAIAATRRAGESAYGPQIAACLVALGRGPEARQTIAAWLKLNPHDSIAAQARWPLVEPGKATWLAALRSAGLPEG